MPSLELIQQIITQYFKDKPVLSVFLFGSYARGTANEESDIDILLYPDRSSPEPRAFYSWCQDLTRLFNIEVDVISYPQDPEINSRWAFLERIDGEKVLLYSKATAVST